MESAIRVEHVSKTFKLPHERQNSIKGALISRFKGNRMTYEKQEALKDISFEVRKGDFFAIVGRNGSGKSTLLKLLAGIYRPTSGGIEVNGKLTPFIELGVGFSPELSGRENVFLNGALLGFNRKQMEKMYDDIVAFAELERFMDQKLKNYSSGMQVRLAFSIAIRAQTDILLLDEVLAVGDAAFQQKCFNYFEELKKQNKTVVFVSHDMSAVTRFCNRAIYIKDGVLIHDGSPSEIADMYTLDNLPKEAEPSEDDHSLAGFSVRSKITKQNASEVTIAFDIQSPEDTDVYIALSVIKDGQTVGEITTPMDMKLSGKESISYTLDKKLFNAGIYEVPVVLCKKENRQLASIGRSKNRFNVEGNDITKGGAMKLDHTWQNS